MDKDRDFSNSLLAIYLLAAILNLKRKRGWGGSCEDVGSKDAAVKPPWMGLRRSSKGPPHPQNHAKNIKLGIADYLHNPVQVYNITAKFKSKFGKTL